MDEIDRILASEDVLEPSSGFASSVLDAVRREAAEPPPLPFPWLRFALGLGACVLLASSGTALALRLAVAVGTMPLVRQFTAVAPELGYAALAVLASLLIARLPRVFAGR